VQLPQCNESVCGLMHWPLQLVVPVGQPPGAPPLELFDCPEGVPEEQPRKNAAMAQPKEAVKWRTSLICLESLARASGIGPRMSQWFSELALGLGAELGNPAA